MTVLNQIPVNAWVGDGVDPTWDYTFEIIDTTELVVTVDDVVQTEGINYTVAISGQSGGTVTFQAGSIPADQSAILFARNTARTQDVDLVTGRRFEAETLEEMSDKLTRIAQENDVSGATLVINNPAYAGLKRDANRPVNGLDATPVPLNFDAKLPEYNMVGDAGSGNNITVQIDGDYRLILTGEGKSDTGVQLLFRITVDTSPVVTGTTESTTFQTFAPHTVVALTAGQVIQGTVETSGATDDADFINTTLSAEKLSIESGL